MAMANVSSMSDIFVCRSQFQPCDRGRPWLSLPGPLLDPRLLTPWRSIGTPGAAGNGKGLDEYRSFMYCCNGCRPKLPLVRTPHAMQGGV